ncbi:MAG: hypothetical protein ACLPUG_02885 [Acidimicrobiales bacterium]
MMVGGNHLGAIHASSIARVGVVIRINGKHAQVYDGPGELVDEIDHLGDRRSGRGADDDKRARSDDRAVAGFVKESPDEIAQPKTVPQLDWDERGVVADISGQQTWWPGAKPRDQPLRCLI